ncbi:denticleless protein [Trifolium repens]|nr:denticleless protein [Trifolium repens]
MVKILFLLLSLLLRLRNFCTFLLYLMRKDILACLILAVNSYSPLAMKKTQIMQGFVNGVHIIMLFLVSIGLRMIHRSLLLLVIKR